MKTQATLKMARISAQKARLVANVIRGMHVREAGTELKYMNKKAAEFFADLLQSAIANAEHNNSLDPEVLYVSEVIVNEGPTFKRFQPRAFGRAFPILKRTCHITVSVEEKPRDVKLVKAAQDKSKVAPVKPKTVKAVLKKESAQKAVKKSSKDNK